MLMLYQVLWGRSLDLCCFFFNSFSQRTPIYSSCIISIKDTIINTLTLRDKADIATGVCIRLIHIIQRNKVLFQILKTQGIKIGLHMTDAHLFTLV